MVYYLSLAFALFSLIFWDSDLKFQLREGRLMVPLIYFASITLTSYLLHTTRNRPGYLKLGLINHSIAELPQILEEWPFEKEKDLMKFSLNAEEQNFNNDSGIQEISTARIETETEIQKIEIPERHFCEHCQYLQPYRTRHCHSCQACVAKFDHHCFWIGGCVGELNHRKFFALVLNASVMCFISMVYVDFFD